MLGTLLIFSTSSISLLNASSRARVSGGSATAIRSANVGGYFKADGFIGWFLSVVRDGVDLLTVPSLSS
jgi:hypothetical protein